MHVDNKIEELKNGRSISNTALRLGRGCGAKQSDISILKTLYKN